MPGRTGSFKEDPNTGRLIFPHGLIDAMGGEEYGNLSAFLLRIYLGSGIDNVELELETTYTGLIIVPGDSRDVNIDHLAFAYVLGPLYGHVGHVSAGQKLMHRSSVAANPYFQGPVGTKIRLGSDGGNALGTNMSARLYAIIGLHPFTIRT